MHADWRHEALAVDEEEASPHSDDLRRQSDRAAGRSPPHLHHEEDEDEFEREAAPVASQAGQLASGRARSSSASRRESGPQQELDYGAALSLIQQHVSVEILSGVGSEMRGDGVLLWRGVTTPCPLGAPS